MAVLHPTVPNPGEKSGLCTGRMPGAVNDLNPADFTVLQPYLDSVRVERGVGEKVLDDASGLLPGALVLFEDY